jgi:ribonuclease P protein component
VAYRFRWTDRLHLRREFKTVFQKGERYTRSGLVLWVYRKPESNQAPRLGMAIPSAYGNAVARNRLKRLIREVFRLNKGVLPPGIDMVLSSRTEIPKVRYQTLEPVIKDLWKKAELIS